MKSLLLIATLVFACLVCAEEAKPESELDRKIEVFRKQYGAYNAVLINNSKGRALNKDGQVIRSEGLGTIVNRQDVPEVLSS